MKSKKQQLMIVGINSFLKSKLTKELNFRPFTSAIDNIIITNILAILLVIYYLITRVCKH